MTTDLFSGDITKIWVQNQEFKVIKHIYSSLVLIGHGTHVFLLLKGHGISEIDILSSISNTLKNDTNSTDTQRGRLTNKPPEHLHHQVVTGPVRDPLTSFHSHEEFVQVLLNCIDWLEYLHKKCKLVHGDLSINNIEWPAQITRASLAMAQAAFIAAPTEGLTESILVTGIIINYDYAHKGTLPFMLLATLDKENSGKYIHGLAQDLESLLYTALGIVTFTIGPCGQAHAPTDHIDCEQLLKDKAIDLVAYNRKIQKYIPEYWKPFSPYLCCLVQATWP
ncbi:hypothetical protein CPB84DRAFT_1816005 [Gymnopilus junonius]|uniref:Fungal-type protein kinase domain-containing protein n=1 Tax=Gymnopilus junonius TaxID=109634 RepID=A0A9P5NLH0_GYMJU|nr:hypothetical protein CPB84DRAFT_1816005 [Gymnopilus junonius]